MTCLGLVVAQLEAVHYNSRVATFGDRLRELREGRDLSQEKLAKLLRQKRPSSVQGWESGRTGLPRPSMIKKLAKALQVDLSDMFKGVVTEHDRLRGPAMVTLLGTTSLLSAEAQSEVAELAQQLAAAAGIQWRDVRPVARKRGTPGRAHTSHR